jgi:hypothetical protein
VAPKVGLLRTLDVLTVVRSLKKNEFVLSEVYDHADQLAEFHRRTITSTTKSATTDYPARTVIPSERQRVERSLLQLLRDINVLEFLAPGSYGTR